MYDVIIIGSGPAGVSAAVYLTRFNHRVCVISNNQSSLENAKSIQNYYALKTVSGHEVYENGLAKLAELNIPHVTDTVLEINFGKKFSIKTTLQEYEAKFVILATGANRNKLNIKNIELYEMRGLSYCATCDGFFYRNKKIAIIGNGEEMLHELSYLESITKDITIFTNGVSYHNSHFKVVTDPIIAFYGEHDLEGITTTKGDYPFAGAFIAFGASSTFGFVKHLGLKIDPKSKAIAVNQRYETNLKGLYAIGDAVGAPYQITKASYDGMMVAYHIHEALNAKN